MRRRLLTALLVLTSAWNAAAQRVTLEVPLSPTPSVSASAAALGFQRNPAPLALSSGLSLWNEPSLSAVTPLPARVLPLTPVKAAPSVAQPLAARPVPAALAAVKPVPNVSENAANSAKVIDSLREHGALSAAASKQDGEDGKAGAEKNFLNAASLGGPNDRPASALEIKPTEDTRALVTRMLERVKLDDRGKADEKEALERQFLRMLATPTGARLAEQFLAEGLTAEIHFEDFPDSKLLLIDGRQKFFAAQAYTHWKQDGTIEVKLNRHFVDGDREIMHETLPWVIGHELLGHGLWYGRAAKENLYTAYHYHELNETEARNVGWAIDLELDGKFEEQGVWSYLEDPAYYLAHLKMRLPYYAVTFSAEEMADAMGTLRARVSVARSEIERAKRNLAAQKTWTAVIDHFATGHGIAEGRFTMLRKEQADLITHYEMEIDNSEAVLAGVTELLGKMEADNEESQKYLQAAGKSDLFARLAAENDRLTTDLREKSRHTPREPARQPPPRPEGQISWAELSQMYHDDVAADAKRKAGEKHWQ